MLRIYTVTSEARPLGLTAMASDIEYRIRPNALAYIVNEPQCAEHQEWAIGDLRNNDDNLLRNAMERCLTKQED